MISVWSPKNQKTTLSSLTHSGKFYLKIIKFNKGNIFGIAMGQVIGGLMCDINNLNNGWTYYFYFSGIIFNINNKIN